MRRPIVSELPPAAKGDTMRTGRAGQSCAGAAAPSTKQATAIEAGRRATGVIAPAASGNPPASFASPGALAAIRRRTRIIDRPVAAAIGVGLRDYRGVLGRIHAAALRAD